jgi:hypothetical protein
VDRDRDDQCRGEGVVLQQQFAPGRRQLELDGCVVVSLDPEFEAAEHDAAAGSKAVQQGITMRCLKRSATSSPVPEHEVSLEPPQLPWTAMKAPLLYVVPETLTLPVKTVWGAWLNVSPSVSVNDRMQS